MRDNEDRIGTKKPQSDPPMAEAIEAVSQPPSPAAKSPLSFVAPTEFVNLPSKGKYYPKEHPLHGEETLEIKMMTTKQEDILTSKSLLKKGVAIDRFLESLLCRQDVKAADLLVGDKNALLVAARISGYGADYVTQVTCPACSESTNFEFDLEEYSAQEGLDSSEREGVRLGDLAGSLTFFITLPKTGWEVGCRPLYGRDEQKIAKLSQNKKKAEHTKKVKENQNKIKTVRAKTKKVEAQRAETKKAVNTQKKKIVKAKTQVKNTSNAKKVTGNFKKKYRRKK